MIVKVPLRGHWPRNMSRRDPIAEFGSIARESSTPAAARVGVCPERKIQSAYWPSQPSCKRRLTHWNRYRRPRSKATRLQNAL